MSDDGRITPENAREMAQRSVEARRRKAQHRAMDHQLRAEAVRLRIADVPPREQLADHARAVLFMLTEKVLADEIQIRTPSEASRVAETFFNVLRLESGQSTSNVENMSREEREALVRDLQGRARERRALHVVPGPQPSRPMPPAPSADS